MKNLSCIIFGLLFSVTLFAQPLSEGVYTSESGKSLKMKLMGGQEGEPILIIEDEARIKGTFSKDYSRLNLKSTAGHMVMKLVDSRKIGSDQKGLIIFVGDFGRVAYQKVKGPLSLSGWDEGVAAIVVNHEEQ